MDKLIQDQHKKHSSPQQLSPARSGGTSTNLMSNSMTPISVQGQQPTKGIKLKIRGDTIVDSGASVEHSSNMITTEKFNLVIKKNADSSSSSVIQVVKHQQRSIPKLKITSKNSSSGFSLENLFPGNKKLDQGAVELLDVNPIMFDDDNEEEVEYI